VAEKTTIEPNTLWRRKLGNFTHVVYEVITHRGGVVSYRVYGQKMLTPFHDDIFLRDFEMLNADEVLAVTKGIF
jgi:hypothetical protein